MSKKRRTTDDYVVGYGKPPAATRFRPGQSGNPKGRRKGQRNFDTELERALNEKVTVMIGGRPRLITKQAAITMQLVNSGAKGDLQAIRMVAMLRPPSVASVAGALESADDKRVLADLVKRFGPEADGAMTEPAAVRKLEKP